MKALIIEFQDTNEGQRELIAKQGADFKEINDLSVTLDEIENYSCRSCLLFHGIREDIQESTDEKALHVINNMLGLKNASLSDITRTHRIGTKGIVQCGH